MVEIIGPIFKAHYGISPAVWLNRFEIRSHCCPLFHHRVISMATAAIISVKPPASFYCGGNRRDGGRGITIARVSRDERFHERIVGLSASTVLFIGLSSLRVCSPASARILPPPIVVTENEINTETVAGAWNWTFSSLLGFRWIWILCSNGMFLQVKRI